MSLISFSAVYIISAIYNYRWIRIAYSKGGIWCYDVPDIDDIVFLLSGTFIPIWNTMMVFVRITMNPRKEDKEVSEKIMLGFFGIKK